MEQKYIIANIRIPVDIKPDKTFVPFKDHITVEFTETDQLPPKQEHGANYDNVLESFNFFLDQKKEAAKLETPEELIKGPNSLTVQKDEIKDKHQTPKINTSFKQKKLFRNRHTKRSV